MNPTFLAAVRSRGGPGANIRTAVGTIPAHVNPPGEPVAETPTGSFLSLASSESKPAAAPRSSVQVASAAPAGSSGGIGGFFGNLFGSKDKDQPAEPRAATPETPKSKSAARPPQVAAVGAIRPKQSETQAESKAAARPSKPQPAQETQQASAEPPAKPANGSSLLNGAAPTVPSGGFENRFGSWR
jgi:outer membrane biosynthesis protein TonB